MNVLFRSGTVSRGLGGPEFVFVACDLGLGVLTCHLDLGCQIFVSFTLLMCAHTCTG